MKFSVRSENFQSKFCGRFSLLESSERVNTSLRASMTVYFDCLLFNVDKVEGNVFLLHTLDDRNKEGAVTFRVPFVRNFGKKLLYNILRHFFGSLWPRNYYIELLWPSNYYIESLWPRNYYIESLWPRNYYIESLFWVTAA